MIGKNSTIVLAFFLIAILGFVAVQVINIVTKDPLPKTATVQLKQVDPNLNQNVFSGLK